MSILLACIATELGPEGQCGDWTAQIVRADRLTNPGKPPEKRRKLRLQDGDEEEYQRGLEGHLEGTGVVAQAWRIARRLVARHDVPQLLKGLERLRAVSIGLADNEDPQQIFESLNATGRPLTESEKVKNWLLMGLADEEQQDVALPQIRMLPACLTEMLPIVFREPGGNGLKRAWHCLPFEADSSFLEQCARNF